MTTINKKTRRTFSPEFRLETAPLVLDQGYPHDEAAKAMGIETEEVEVPVVRVSEPKNGAHPLGIIAAFGTEREAIRFVEKYYRRNRELMEDNFELCISKLLL